ncbi:bifunctional adenosylcobinamide kinase/adenosylcobinamide-phosphate guanylyltransferase (plasmid) [Pseudorhodobacter turbinis]|uniref:Bifunctional adenosylcobalamin biosynthesis protein n=1 Tax=Pseudorhodobacter turbinis TaxID=2500533 RepID=A0A4V1E132_9RHOB|nr:bifunctional adenosylcobinamide kinase/adenosylcobinamide-phosphate guanylyltransferase [Pseudorhodobacter turbinis]QCO56724.1 bifunctional adenosylcobinamide kinase/adenosylcobinamide-phosphate guanylyltransferase [Pseudorhodobacter turbinis]
MTQKNLPPLSLVTGGAKSGKSRFAEELVTGSGLRQVYLATAQVWDDEMRAKIDAHRTSRGPDWHTVEAPRDVVTALQNVCAGDVVLLDCATMWLTNLMLEKADMEAEIQALLAALAICPAPVVIVTNELGWSIVPDNALARQFRDAQGRLNQDLATQAGLVVAVVSGLPLVLKGTL